MSLAYRIAEATHCIVTERGNAHCGRVIRHKRHIPNLTDNAVPLIGLVPTATTQAIVFVYPQSSTSQKPETKDLARNLRDLKKPSNERSTGAP